MWGSILTEVSYLQNFNMGFSNTKSDILIHLTQWQYWWWFWFSFLWILYYLLVARVFRYRTLKFNPRIASTLRPHGKWGDFLTCLIPITWCINILINSNFILKLIEWQSESSLFTLRVRAKQWYWIYKLDLRNISDIYSAPRSIGRNKWQSSTFGDLQTSEDYLHLIQMRAYNSWSKNYWQELFKKFEKKKKWRVTSPVECYRGEFLKNLELTNIINLCEKKNLYFIEKKNDFSFIEKKIDRKTLKETNDFLVPHFLEKPKIFCDDSILFNCNGENFRSYLRIMTKVDPSKSFSKEDVYAHMKAEKPFVWPWIANIRAALISPTDFFEIIWPFVFKYIFIRPSTREVHSYVPSTCGPLEKYNSDLEFKDLSQGESYFVKKNYDRIKDFFKKRIHDDIENGTSFFQPVDYFSEKNFLNKSKIIIQDGVNFKTRILERDPFVYATIVNRLMHRYQNHDWYKIVNPGYYIANYKSFHRWFYISKKNYMHKYQTQRSFGMSSKECDLLESVMDKKYCIDLDTKFSRNPNFKKICKKMPYKLRRKTIFKDQKLTFAERQLIKEFEDGAGFNNKADKVGTWNFIKDILVDSYLNSTKFVRHPDYDEDTRLIRMNFGKTAPLRIIKKPHSDIYFTKGENFELFRFRYNMQQSNLGEKPIRPTVYLTFKQKRYTLKNNISSQLLTNGNEKYSTNPFLKNSNIIQENVYTPTKQYKLVKKAKSRAENFTQNNWNRLLRSRRVLVLPAHVNITVITNSFDIVHSWHIPGLGLKMDCLPGRATHHTLYIDNVGFYYGQCAEICGRYHHHMPIRICALPFEHFLVWWHTFGLPKLLFVHTQKDATYNLRTYYDRKFSW